MLDRLWRALLGDSGACVPSAEGGLIRVPPGTPPERRAEALRVVIAARRTLATKPTIPPVEPGL